ARQRQHVCRNTAARQARARRSDQLGAGGGKDANLPAVGFLGTPLHRPRAGRVVPRDLSRERRALQERRDRPDSPADEKLELPGRPAHAPERFIFPTARSIEIGVNWSDIFGHLGRPIRSRGFLIGSEASSRRGVVSARRWPEPARTHWKYTAYPHRAGGRRT